VKVKLIQASDESGREAGARDLRAVADRVEIEALRGEFVDALMMGDYDRFESLFADEGVWRIPYIDVELVGRGEIHAGIERMQGLWEDFVQTSHPGTIELDGDTAAGRAYVSEFGHMRGGRSDSILPCITTATSARWTAGSSPSASTRSDISTPLRWRARRPVRRVAPASPGSKGERDCSSR
jgi:hypothetical protein